MCIRPVGVALFRTSSNSSCTVGTPAKYRCTQGPANIEHTFLIRIFRLSRPVRNVDAFLSINPRRSLNPPPGFVAALLSFSPRTRRKVRCISCARVRAPLPEDALEIRDARVDALPLPRCFNTVCAALETPFGPGADDLVVGRLLIELGSVGGAFLFRRAAESMSKSPSPSVRPAPPFLF